MQLQAQWQSQVVLVEVHSLERLCLGMYCSSQQLQPVLAEREDEHVIDDHQCLDRELRCVALFERLQQRLDAVADTQRECSSRQSCGSAWHVRE